MAGKPKSSEIHPGPGFRITKSVSRPPEALIKQYAEYDSTDISDLMNRLYTMQSHIHNLVNDDKIVGSVCTVKVYPGDNLMVHKALDIAKPGDIIVVDACGSRMNAIIGDMIAIKAKHRGIAGFVIDGLVRDLGGLKEIDLPIFASGVTTLGPLHRGPGEINFPVSCGGVVVNPGDILIGDLSGVTVVRKDFAEGLLERLQLSSIALQAYLAELKKGIFSNEWVDNLLTESQCVIHD